MDDTELRLDGNAAAGIMRDLFVYELTAARGECAVCGTIGMMGGQHLYMYPLSPGAVLRCSSCGNVLMVLVRGRGRYRLGVPGLKWLEMDDPDAATAAVEPA